MATLDQDQNSVVLRIVYSGAPMSGKTESVRSLSELIFGTERGQQEFYSPDETSGRTLYFDWLNYVGGYFKGYKLNCQLISVPGQKTLQNRRQLLLEMADVVVFVLDSDSDKIEVGREYYREMEPWLQREGEPPVGVVVQANKRDLDNAASMPLIRQTFDDNPNLLILESIATQSSGIRETFVSAVRIGIERATWLMDNGKMPTGPSDLESGDALLKLIQSKESIEREHVEQTYSEQDDISSIPAPKSANLDLSSTQLHQIIVDSANKEIPPTSEAIPTISVDIDKPIFRNTKGEFINSPKPPDKEVGAGKVYPPVSGRIILHQLTSHSDKRIMHHVSGDWEMELNSQWKLLSREDTCFKTANEASKLFMKHAQVHQQLKNVLSEHRCLAIVEEASLEYPWRIWHVVRIETSLSELLSNSLKNPAPRRVAERVFIIAEKFLQAHQMMVDSKVQLAFSLENIGLNRSVMGLDKSVLAYIDFIPDIENDVPLPPVMEALAQNFKQPIHDMLANASAMPIPYILHQLEIYSRGDVEKMLMVDVLRTLFIGEH